MRGALSLISEPPEHRSQPQLRARPVNFIVPVAYVREQIAGLHEGNAIRYRLKPGDLEGVNLRSTQIVKMSAGYKHDQL